MNVLDGSKPASSMIMGIVYMKWVLPDLIAVKYARQKYIPEHTSRHENKGWVDYKL